jgi:hypothetical protein
METLAKTTPLIRGPQVTDAQQHLAGKNPFHEDYLRDDVDGVFGEATARACRRAKYWLGYPEWMIDGHAGEIYGTMLAVMLTGERKIPAAYRLRRGRRLKARDQKPLGLKALERAIQNLGDTEKPKDSNKVSWASLWYGVIGAWCAMSVTRWYVDVGSKAFKRGARYSYVPYIVHDARAGMNGLHVVRFEQAKSGEIVTYDWQHDRIADHTGLFAEEHDLQRLVPSALRAAVAEFGHLGTGEFWAVEGNTGVGNDSNGGEVMIRKRDLSEVILFARVGR